MDIASMGVEPMGVEPMGVEPMGVEPMGVESRDNESDGERPVIGATASDDAGRTGNGAADRPGRTLPRLGRR
ncbi:hypothetical protein [Frankia sp. AvcI1]|uniref:hypothetical protein n=1 Tax=Frankia sp. AvcI1 TaxID=573496 RepID=UPI0006EC28DC|nr:hypothetical protein [Frankia sp. AvcI1]